MKSRGLALVELVIVVGLVMALGAGVAAIAWHVDETAQVDRAAKQFRELLDAIDGSNGSAIGHFSGINAEHIAQEELAPPAMIENGGLRSRWGPIELEPLTVDPRRPHAHVRITYSDIPQALCFPLVRAIEQGVDTVRVNGVAVFDANLLNIAKLQTACGAADPATISLDHDGGGGGDPALL